MNIISDIRNHRQRAGLLLALAGCCALSAGAVKGIVVNEYGQPVAQAQVTVKGTDTSVLTGEDGVFDLNVTGNTDLSIVAPGYLVIDFNAGALRRQKDKDNVKIVLTELNVPLKATIPGVYGEKPADSYLGSASTIYTDQLNRTMGSTIIPGMVDRIAGLNIQQARGFRTFAMEGNSTATIAGWAAVLGGKLYGENSEYGISSRGMSPIVYIDGIERDFYAIDVDAVESVSLQKDALSTMFNGMRSSRPVLLITTKNPQSQGFRVSFTGRFGIASPIRKYNPLSTTDYAYLLNEALQNDGRSPIYNHGDYDNFLNGNNPMIYPDVDWYGQIMRDHSTSQYYNVNVSGGNNFAQYFVNAGYYYENGLFKDWNEDYDTQLKTKRYMMDSKVNMHITKDFTASVSVLGRIEDSNQPGGNGIGYTSLLSQVWSTPNNAYPIYNPNGSWGGNVSFNNNLLSQAGYSGYITTHTRDLLGLINLKYDFDRYVKGLSVYAMGSVSVQELSVTYRTSKNPVYRYSVNEEGLPIYNRFGTIENQKNDYNAIANYQQLWGKFGVDYERQWGLHHFKAGLSGDTRQNINNYDLPALPSNIMQTLAYDYDKKYFAQAAVTESYYNRYAPGRRWGAFYAFGLGWDMAREKFMASAGRWMDQLKFRLVYGRTGNGVENSGYYNYYQTYTSNSVGGYNWGTQDGTLGTVGAVTPLANPYITWEKAHKWDVGIDASFFNNRLLLQADYYNDKYFDLLQARGKSIELMGISYPAENIGKMRRYGGEISLTWQDNVGDFNYYVTGNWNVEQSTLLYFDEQEREYEWMVRTGRHGGVRYGYICDGFYTSREEIEKSPVIAGYDNIQPGDLKYRDLNGDGVINEFDETVIGGEKPFQYYGIDFGFNWKDFEFSMNWQGTYNREIYVMNSTLTNGFGRIGQTYGQAYDLILGRWTPETAETAYLPRLTSGDNDYNGKVSSFWLKNGNFLRCKNLYVGYTLPQTFCRNFLGGVRPKIFVNVQNLCTISAYDWDDPEVSFTSYPIQRMWSMGINLKF
ncbi:MAG: SusC/RagA family TonB-linked outer membrane protein [Muribaculaceae bacterium]|nr:SusC/RagA family TonB-linked outer membrane protein [Muribaculaceae bacterium]